MTGPPPLSSSPPLPGLLRSIPKFGVGDRPTITTPVDNSRSAKEPRPNRATLAPRGVSGVNAITAAFLLSRVNFLPRPNRLKRLQRRLGNKPNKTCHWPTDPRSQNKQTILSGEDKVDQVKP